ncbi:MAG: hypothetical protein KBT22_07115 [Bacteroidales bacterium]|nr:hypothetical protein [Candidatus Scybalocola fimicaballi]
MRFSSIYDARTTYLVNCYEDYVRNHYSDSYMSEEEIVTVLYHYADLGEYDRAFACADDALAHYPNNDEIRICRLFLEFVNKGFKVLKVWNPEADYLRYPFNNYLIILHYMLDAVENRTSIDAALKKAIVDIQWNKDTDCNPVDSLFDVADAMNVVCKEDEVLKMVQDVTSKMPTKTDNDRRVKAECYIQLADYLVGDDKYKYATEMYESLVDEHPYCMEAWLAQGILHFMNFNYPEAKLSFDFARAIDPENDRLHLWFGKVLAATGKFKDAVKELRMHGMLYPTDVKAKIELANCYLMSDDYKKAASILETIPSTHSDFHNAQYSLAVCYNQSDRNKEALSCVNEAIRRVERDYYDTVISDAVSLGSNIYKMDWDESPCWQTRVDYYLLKADILVCLEEFNEAESIYRFVLEMDKDNADAISALGHIYMDRKDFRNAINMYDEAISINADNVEEIYALKAVAYYKMRDIQSAATSMRETGEDFMAESLFYEYCPEAKTDNDFQKFFEHEK